MSRPEGSVEASDVTGRERNGLRWQAGKSLAAVHDGLEGNVDLDGREWLPYWLVPFPESKLGRLGT